MPSTEFPWGTTQSFGGAGPIILLAAWALAVGVHCTLLCRHGASAGAEVGDAAPPLSALRGVALVTLAMNAVFYNFLGAQMNSRIKDMATGDGVSMPDSIDDPANFSALRSMGNFHEQRVMFLTSMWLYALFVNPSTAAVLGTVWVITRAFYPFMFGAFAQFTPLVELVTQQGYMATYWMSTGTILKIVWAVDLHAWCESKGVAAQCGIMLAILLGHGAMLMWNIIGVPAALWMKSRGEMAVTKGYGIYASKPKAS